ncbi:hypothetical protein JCM8547_002166 [Rhodosporidiobolus lusitaniae]
MSAKVPRLAVPRWPRLPAIVAPPSSASLGSAYELLSLNALLQPPFFFTNLARVGGANDQGVDLHGEWSGRPLLPLSLVGGADLSSKNNARWPAIVQCKAYSDRVGPVTVRELEGALLAASSSFSSSLSSSRPADQPGVAFLLSLSGFTPIAASRIRSSTLPIAGVHLAPRDPKALLRAASVFALRGKLGSEKVEMDVKAVVWSNVTRLAVQREAERLAAVEEVEEVEEEKMVLQAG